MGVRVARCVTTTWTERHPQRVPYLEQPEVLHELLQGARGIRLGVGVFPVTRHTRIPAVIPWRDAVIPDAPGPALEES